MDAFHRLLRFGGAAKTRALPAWRAAVLRSAPARQWLELQSERGLQWLKLRPRVTAWAGGIGIAFVLFGFVIGGGASWYAANAPAIAPLLTLVAGVSVAAVALVRHLAQTDADRQRRITESFSKAVEQLGSDKLEVRLGGIYSLERISKESPDDYWTVMENLTAFVRERSRRNEAERTALDFEQRVSRRAYFLWREAGRPDRGAEWFWAEADKQEKLGEPPAADVAAALTAIKRQSERGRERESANDERLDLSGAILRRANLRNIHFEGADLGRTYLEGADLRDAHLEGADLWRAHLEGAHLEGANLRGARLERANLWAHLGGAHLEGANLFMAHLEGADLWGAHLEGADLRNAHLEGANLKDAQLKGADLGNANLGGADLGRAHLEGANLRGAHLLDTNLTEKQLAGVVSDAATRLPEGMERPAHWPGKA